MDFASQDECKDKVSNGSLSYLTKDKFCAKADLSGELFISFFSLKL